MARLLVLDGLGLVYRAYYAFIARPLTNSRGENTSAIHGFANSVIKLRREFQPDYWALAWDGPGPTFRHERFDRYKATRKPMPADLVTQIPAIEDIARALGLPLLEVPGAEADDVMATLARRGAADGLEVLLVTGDKDMLQVVGERVSVLNPQGRGEDYTRLDADGVRAKWSVGPEHIRDVLALMGDASDNVPGVPGIGEKGAKELIGRFESLENLYAHLDEIGKPALKQKLETHRDQALLSRELVTVRDDLDLPAGWEHLRVAPVRRDDLAQLARHYELVRLERIAQEQGVSDADAGRPVAGRSLDRRSLPAEAAPSALRPAPALPRPAPPPAPPPSGAVQGTLDLFGAAAGAAGRTIEETVARLHAVRARAIHGLGVLPLGAGPDPRRDGIVGLAVAARDGSACYVPLAHATGPNLPLERVREWLTPAFADPTCPKACADVKRDAHRLAASGWTLEGAAFDVHLGSFLCDPERDHGLDALARDVLGIALPALDDAARGRGRAGPASVAPETVAESLEARAAALFPLAEALRAQLEAREQWALYHDLEHPLIAVLLAMERAGVAVDRQVLREMSERAGSEIERLERELREVAGAEVNLNSGPQLQELLFVTLGLPRGRRTRTGFAVDQAVLEELATAHPFARTLLEYRALGKLRSTYLDALPLQVDPVDGRIHTTYHQAGAATGRLSSSDPNLQNIPMRTPQGRAIRRAFVAPPGAILVGADYSQVELRIMAHLSGDPQLIEAFESGEDVHASTARRIFGISGVVDPDLRARAKVVNFGVMYGMGSRSLSQQMGIGLTEAQEFIQNYFRVYARVREYLDQVVEDARRDGYVQTLLGRRRWLPALRSPHGAERSFAERAAINTPLQGSAADLMKLAMIRVHRALKGFGPSARLLLQVHDELLIECPAADADAIVALVRREMEGCYPLRVPLVVSHGTGPTWFDVH